MDDYRPRRSPATERFVGLFSSPSSSPTEPSFIAGDEFHEDDFMFSSSDAAAAPPDDSPAARVPHAHLGLLAALHDGDRRLLVRRGAAASDAIPAALLRRKATIAAAAASASSGGGSLSPTQPPPSAAWAIPANPRPRSRTAPAPQYHQSAPVKVPVRPPRKPAMDRWDEAAADDDDELRRGDAAMLPPHEMVARASAGGAGPVAPFSMLEGAGRTLKGRDLRRVRDAVLRQTGWLD
ncbi:uncharacterized protein LOC124670308 [Lolium rigidum]|uniref:uncharacterized protein LOC124670308 n=1 Tax=Lolium rigidum TaxID=89674 RepID=UPI001F5C5C2E|nr:uncharacterized protein LOC124670308 [Lolium rigidum]